MIGILLMSHGKMAEGMLDSCQLFFGEAIQQLQALCLAKEESVEGFDERIRNQVSYAECQTAETLGTMRVPAEFKLNNVACSILLFFPISTG